MKQLDHNTCAAPRCDGVTSVGQNLYMGGASLGTNITRFIQLWNDEKKDYTYSDGSCSKVCGHYTQVRKQNTQIQKK